MLNDQASSLRSLNILIFEPNPHWQKVLTSLLHSVGIENIKSVKRYEPTMKCMLHEADLIIMDCQLEEQSGFEAVKAIRTLGDTDLSAIPIIMTSEQTTRGKIMQAIHVGCNEYLEKPVSRARLVDRLHAVVKNPREYIKIETYFGPDRRRGANPNYDKEDRRGSRKSG